MDLDSMKYAELRSLAKELGLKANVKADKLREAIKRHQQKNEEEQKEAAKVMLLIGWRHLKQGVIKDEDNNNTEVADVTEEVSHPAVFVNTRRGKSSKRKISDPAPLSASGDKKTPRTAKAEAEEETRSSPHSAKKRKVSSDTDTEASPELQDEPQASTRDKEAPYVESETARKVAKVGKIPRLRGGQRRAALKPVTPNFKKLHEAQFNKMESIDAYVQRKTKKVDDRKSPSKELKEPSDKTKPSHPEKKVQRSIPARVSMFSPVPEKKPVDEKSKHSLVSAGKAPPSNPGGKVAPFRPSVLSMRRVNVRFSECTRDNESKGSLLKTPARMSPCVVSSTPQKQTGEAGKPHVVRLSAFSGQKTPGTFVFNGNTSITPGTQKKPGFDLKASLARPLSYKPHTGKLKPFGEAKENTAGDKSLVSHSRQETYKQHKPQTREDRRTRQAHERKQKKEGILGARRGLTLI